MPGSSIARRPELNRRLLQIQCLMARPGMRVPGLYTILNPASAAVEFGAKLSPKLAVASERGGSDMAQCRNCTC